MPAAAFRPLVGAEHFAHHADDFQPFHDAGHHRAAGDEGFQRGVPTLLHVFGIVLFGQFGRDLDQLQGHDIQPIVFEAGQNPPDQAALDTVGFQQNQGTFHGRRSPSQSGK